jgi:hypothetical protein
MPEFFERYGMEAKCSAALMALRWARCDSGDHYVVGHGVRRLFQWRGCRRQTSLTAGSRMNSTKLPLRTWYSAIYLISQHKTGLLSLALKRRWGSSYCGAWLI